MKIIVLAAGEGKRIWPIKTDKSLIPFLGKPLLYHNLKKIKGSLEIDEVIVVSKATNKDGISKVMDELKIKGTIAIQNEPKGMADAILCAKDLIEGEILVVNAEDILDREIYGQVSKIGGDTVFAALKVDKYFPGGYVKKGIGDRVQGIVEKPGEGMEPSDQIKLVVDYFKDGKKLVTYLENALSDRDDVYEVAINNMISDGLDVKVVNYKGVWIPLKYPWQILDVLYYFLSNIEHKIYPGAKVSEKAILEGKVIIEDGVKVFEGAIIKGPCYIGRNCIVGTNSMVRDSILEEGCVTGFDSDITRSYIGANSWFHTNYIGDSCLEGDLGMGSGAVIANLRLDNQTIRTGKDKLDTGRTKLGLIAGGGVRIGVNASIMPGVKVGSGSLIGPGVVLHEDVKENTKLLVKQEYQISEHSPSFTSYDQFREKLTKTIK